MAFTPKRLAQFQAATSETSHYTVPADTLAMVKNIVIANVNTVDVSLGLSIVPSGGVAGVANRIVPGLVIPPLSVVPLDMTQVMDEGDFISAIASLAASLTVTISGMEEPGSNGLSSGTVIGSPPLWGSPVATGNANADGAAGTLPRSDHVHKGILAADQLAAAAPADVALAAVVGTSPLAARQDHVHRTLGMDVAGAQQSAWSTSSTTYVDYGAVPVEATIVKARADTALFILGHMTYYRTATLSGQVLGVRINGTTDYDISGTQFDNELSSHRNIVGNTKITGIAAGTVTVRLRTRLIAGSISVDANDYGQLWVVEGFVA